MLPIIVLCFFYNILVAIVSTILVVLLFRSSKVKVFVSKHEAKGKWLAESVSSALQERGYEIWLSQNQAQKDIESMLQGVADCDVLLLIATPGIFDKHREWVTHIELKSAIDLGKAVIVVDGGIHYSNKLSECGHVVECCQNVRPDFQPYARMIVKALERVKWHGDIQYRSVDLDKIESQICNREKTIQKMKRYLTIELEDGPCPGCCGNDE